MMLKREGIHINHKKVYRLYKKTGLALKRKRKQKIYAKRGTPDRSHLLGPNDRWSILWKMGNKENNEGVVKKICELNRDEKLYTEFLSQPKLLPHTVDYVYNKFLTLKEKTDRISRLRVER